MAEENITPEQVTKGRLMIEREGMNDVLVFDLDAEAAYLISALIPPFLDEGKASAVRVTGARINPLKKKEQSDG